MARGSLFLLALATAIILISLSFRSFGQERPHLIAIADLHGDLRKAREALRLAGILRNDSDSWDRENARNTILVQLGDLVDRGDESLPLINLFQRLRKEAPEANSRVVQLLGNHELMNLQGDFRYFDPKERAQVGLRELKRMLRGGGELAEEMINWRSAAIIEGEGGCATLFVHGGFSMSSMVRDIHQLNERFRRSASTLVNGGQSDEQLFGPHGPFWDRSLALGKETDVCEKVDRALQATGARRIMVGHTVQPHGKPRERCNGRLLLMDVGMSKFYYGAPATLLHCKDGNAEIVIAGRNDELPLR